jgi:zinc protease
MALAVPVLAACSPVQEATLSNGLKVVVKEDHRAPVVVSQIWYKVGASDEPEGLTGISHVLEHMMFKGTPTHPEGEFSRIIAEHGGRENAFTGADYTAYFQQLEKSRLPVAFELEADRMQNLKLDAGEYAKEIRVVMEERRLRTDDQPTALAFEKFMATAYTTGPYRHPIIGWMADLKQLTIGAVRDWYRRWYVPNNATLVVVGDVKPREVFALARQYFGEIPARPVERTPVPVEPPQLVTRTSTLKAPAQAPNLLMGYHVPAFGTRRNDTDPYALMVLNGVLDGGSSARLERDLVRGRELAGSISAGYSPTARYPVLFIVSATPSKGRSVKQLEDAIRAQIRQLQEQPVTAAELERVKAQVAASNVFERDSVFYQAMQMGMLETVGLDWRLLDGYVDRINAVTADQVQSAARRHLTDANLTVTVLEPQPGRYRPSAAAPAGGGNVR